MERRVGEIFEYNGEWYQCVKGSDCLTCDLLEGGYCINNHTLNASCFGHNREDGTKVIFKKLENVGEPYEYNGSFLQRYKIYYDPVIAKDGLIKNYTPGVIEMEIKKKQEDMEEKCDGCKYSDEEIEIMRKAESEVIKVMGGELGIPEKIPYLYSFICGALELGWLDKYKCQSGKLCPFDLEAAKQGKPVCTRDGRKARIICFDYQNENPIIVLIQSEDGKGEDIYEFKQDGKVYNNGLETVYDLMMLPEKKEGWVNIYDDTPVYETKEKAEINSATVKKHIATVKIAWEE